MIKIKEGSNPPSITIICEGREPYVIWNYYLALTTALAMIDALKVFPEHTEVRL